MPWLQRKPRIGLLSCNHLTNLSSTSQAPSSNSSILLGKRQVCHYIQTCGYRAHICRALYQEIEILTSTGKIRNKEENLTLLEVIWLPRKVPIVHCKEQQKGDSPKHKIKGQQTWLPGRHPSGQSILSRFWLTLLELPRLYIGGD